MIFHNFYKSYWVKPNIAGDGNKFVRLYNGKMSDITRKCAEFKLRVQGKNNLIVIEIHEPCRLKHITKYLKKLQINVSGNNNKIHIELPHSFNDTFISLKGDGNVFHLQKSSEYMGKNCRFYAFDGGQIYIGHNCQINNNLYVKIEDDYKEKHKIVIGNNTYIAMDTIIRASDGHSLLDAQTGEPINPPNDIIIGNHCWIMARAIILKGAKIPDNSAVAAASVVNKRFEKENSLLAGIPARVIREGIIWTREGYGTVMKSFENKLK